MKNTPNLTDTVDHEVKKGRKTNINIGKNGRVLKKELDRKKSRQNRNGRAQNREIVIKSGESGREVEIELYILGYGRFIGNVKIDFNDLVH